MNVILELNEQQLDLLIAAFGEINVAVKHIEEHVLPLMEKLEEAKSELTDDHAEVREGLAEVPDETE